MAMALTVGLASIWEMVATRRQKRQKDLEVQLNCWKEDVETKELRVVKIKMQLAPDDTESRQRVDCGRLYDSDKPKMLYPSR